MNTTIRFRWKLNRLFKPVTFWATPTLFLWMMISALSLLLAACVSASPLPPATTNGASNKDKAATENNPGDDVILPTDQPSMTSEVVPTATKSISSNNIVLPVGQPSIAPEDVLSEIQWFDGGASGGDGCDYARSYEGTATIQVIRAKRNSLLLDNKPHEGEHLLACASNLPSQFSFIWTLETPDGESITEQGSSYEFGTAQWEPNFSPVPGQYRIRISSDNFSLETNFEVTPPTTPTIWIVGQIKPGQVATVYYAGFEPQETITTVWYATNSYLDQTTKYLTSWQAKTDLNGRASESISIPNKFCVPAYSLLAARGMKLTAKDWWINSNGSAIDLPASAIIEIHNTYEETNCPLERPGDQQQLDNSSRFLSQVDMGTIHNGEPKSGVLQSVFEAHNWEYQATKEASILIQLNFFNNSFPVGRISIIDPNGKLEYHCMDPIRGCESGKIEYQPVMSGIYTIRVDMFVTGNGEYSLSISPASFENATESNEVIIDDADPGFILEGPPASWRIAPYGYKESTHWTYCTNAGTSNWARWKVQLPQDGNYEVFAYVPEHQAGTTHANYQIVSGDKKTEVVVRQSEYANEWVSLGIYPFAATGEEYIYLDDNTGEPLNQQITIAFDAVKFVHVP